MSDIGLEKLEAWCQDAITLLPTPELPPSFTEQRRETVRRHSRTKALYQIVEDLAEGISELPLREREHANQTLKEKYGFGHEIFTEKKLKRLRAIIRKGKISTDDEFRDLSALASDGEIGEELKLLIEKLLFDYESRLLQNPKKATVVSLNKKPAR